MLCVSRKMTEKSACIFRSSRTTVKIYCFFRWEPALDPADTVLNLALEVEVQGEQDHGDNHLGVQVDKVNLKHIFILKLI